MSDERKAAFNFHQEELANDLNEEKKKTDERIKRHLDIVIRIAGDFHSTLKSERDDIHAEQGEFRSEDLRELFDTVDYFVKNLNQKHKTLRHYQTISRFIEGLEGSESMGDDEDHRVWPLCSLL